MRLSETLSVALLVVSVSAGAAEVAEYQLKAEFIERFTRFIDWPAPSDDASRPFVIGVVGDDPFGPYLDVLARQRTIKNRRVVVRHLTSDDDLRTCDVLFVSRSERGVVGEIVRKAAARPILTIGDTDGYAEAGILINFFIEDNRVQFEINEKAARASGLDFRARLFKLARIVEGED